MLSSQKFQELEKLLGDNFAWDKVEDPTSYAVVGMFPSLGGRDTELHLDDGKFIVYGLPVNGDDGITITLADTDMVYAINIANKVANGSVA